MSFVIAAMVAVWLLVICAAWFPRGKADRLGQVPRKDAVSNQQGTAGNQMTASQQQRDRTKSDDREEV